MHSDKNNSKPDPGNFSEEEKKVVTKLFFERIREGIITGRDKNILKQLEKRFLPKRRKYISKETIYGAEERSIRHIKNTLGIDLKAKKRIPVQSRIAYGVAAACIILLISVALPFMQNTLKQNYIAANSNYKEYRSEKEIRQVTMPDGTVVHLNLNSSLKWKENEFDKKEREIWLEGEAFFDVAKNPAKPFIIHTGNINTTVLGTSFNVEAYKELQHIKVFVRQGRVRVDNQTKNLDILTPDKELVYNTTDNSHKTNNKSWNQNSSWLNGGFNLDGADTQELIFKIKNYYGYRIKLETAIIEHSKINMYMEKAVPVKEVMNVLSGMYGIHYTINNDHTIRIY